MWIQTETFALILAVSAFYTTFEDGLLAAPSDQNQDFADVIRKLESEEPTSRAAAKQSLEMRCKLAIDSKNVKVKRALSKTLLETIARDELKLSTRIALLDFLPRVASYEAVRPVALLLSSKRDPGLRDAARQALEDLPVVTALKPLREALDSARGEFRLAIIQSLGKRQDSLAVGKLLPLAEGENPAVRLVSLGALAEIGDRSAFDTIETAVNNTTPENRESILTSYTRFAWRLRETREGGASRRIFLRLCTMESRWSLEGVGGLAKAGVKKDLPVLLSLLDRNTDTDSEKAPEMRKACLDALKELRGAGKALGAVILDPETAVARRQDLLGVLAARKDVMKATKAIVQSATDVAAEVRMASIHALVKLDVDTAGEALIKLALDSTLTVRHEATKALRDWKAEGAREFLKEKAKASEELRKLLESQP